jgi:hypothetical protein
VEVLEQLVGELAQGIKLADAESPQWVSTRTGKPYLPGIGPHTETQTVALALAALSRHGRPLADDVRLGVAYPSAPRMKCDVVLGAGSEQWAIEIKMLRFMGDNGKPNDNILMHILSPYPAQRSALTDTIKLAASGFPGHHAVVIYGYDYPGWPMDPAIDAFETLANRWVELGPRTMSGFADLVHPIHREGRVLGWEVGAQTGAPLDV